jgi:hypothetical protein
MTTEAKNGVPPEVKPAYADWKSSTVDGPTPEGFEAWCREYANTSDTEAGCVVLDVPPEPQSEVKQSNPPRS